MNYNWITTCNIETMETFSWITAWNGFLIKMVLYTFISRIINTCKCRNENNILFIYVSIQFSCSVMSDSLRPHGLQYSRPPCPSPTPGVHSDSHPSSRWCHPAISSSVVPFSSCLQSLPASGSFPMSQFFTSGGQSIGVSASASVLQMNIQDWSPLGWTGWISIVTLNYI